MQSLAIAYSFLLKRGVGGGKVRGVTVLEMHFRFFKHVTCEKSLLPHHDDCSQSELDMARSNEHARASTVSRSGKGGVHAAVSNLQARRQSAEPTREED
jgi:hypothetical protein